MQPNMAPPKKVMRNSPGRLGDAELAGDGGCDRELEADDARGVVEQRFAFEHANLALRQRGLMTQRAHGDRIGGAECGAERQCSGQREHGPECVQRESDDHHRENGQTNGERQRQLERFEQLALVDLMRLKVEQRRNEQHEEQLRVELHIREERHLRGDETEHDLHERRGDARQEAAQER